MLLVGFMPLVGAMGGNIGLQCSTVTVRGLATGAIVPGRMLASIGREIGTGMLLGVRRWRCFCRHRRLHFTACDHGENAALGGIMATSLRLAVMLAAALGVLIPRLHPVQDRPGDRRRSFITTMLNDVSGYVIDITTVNVLLRAFAT